MSSRAPGCAATARRTSLVVVCGAKRGSGGGGGGKQRQRGGGKPARQDKPPPGQPVTRSKTLAMTEFKADEILMFDPVPAARDALQASAVWCCAAEGCLRRGKHGLLRAWQAWNMRGGLWCVRRRGRLPGGHCVTLPRAAAAAVPLPFS